ncbi:MAG: hypothetical protein JO022_02475 [Acidobacteriaceae bacterium]|nr:hypothetical protein [Acidobacteriaceae bacterium]
MKYPSKWLYGLALVSLVSGTPGFAQDAPPPPPPPSSQSTPPQGGWRKFGENAPPPNPGYSSQANPDQNQAPPPPPQYPADRQTPPVSATPAPLPPARLMIPEGAWITVRVNQLLSSDHNQPGDAFTASLLQPVVVDGWVVAHRGQMVQGRVTEAQKAGRVSGVSRLGVELTVLGTVDGQQVPIKTTATERRGDTSIGRDTAGVAAPTALGAIVGGAAAGGYGAGLGAAAGAGAGLIGVFVTRGKPTVIYPEMAITFRLEHAVAVNTDRAPQAFEQVSGRDYERTTNLQQRPAPGPRPGYGYAPAPGPYAYPYPYPYYGGVYPSYYPWWGGVGVYVGPRYYYRGFRRW